MICGSHQVGQCRSRSSGITYENWAFYCIPRGLIYYMKLRVRASAMRKIVTFEGVHSSNALWHVCIMSQGCAKKESVAGMQYNNIPCVHKRSTLWRSERLEIERLITLQWSPLLMHLVRISPLDWKKYSKQDPVAILQYIFMIYVHNH